MGYNLILTNNLLDNNDSTTTSTITRTITSTIMTTFPTKIPAPAPSTSTTPTTTSITVTATNLLNSNLHITLSSRDISKGGIAAAVIIPISIVLILLISLGIWHWYKTHHEHQTNDIESVNYDNTTMESTLGEEEKHEWSRIDNQNHHSDDNSSDVFADNVPNLAIPKIMTFKPALAIKQLNTPPIEIKELFKRASIVPDVEVQMGAQWVSKRSNNKTIPLPDSTTISNLRTQTR